MNDKTAPEDRSMSEILSSIRRIVTDEEQSRREGAQEGPHGHQEPGGGGAEVFVLTEAMRAAPPKGGAPQPDAVSPIRAAATAGAEAGAQGNADAGKTEAEIEDIVRRVVREELKGPIGQQISRKVKRMVREEIARAMGETDEDSLI